VEAFVTPGFSGRSKSKIGLGGSGNKDLARLNSAENDFGNSYFGRGDLEFQTKIRRNGESDKTDQKKELKQYKNGFKAFASGALGLAGAIFFGGDTSASAIVTPSGHSSYPSSSSTSSTVTLASTATATEEAAGTINAASDESLLGDFLKVIMDGDDGFNDNAKNAASTPIKDEQLTPETVVFDEDAASEELRKAQEAVKAAQAKLEEAKKESETRQLLGESSKPAAIKALAEEKKAEEIKPEVEKVATTAASKSTADAATKEEEVKKVLEPKRVEQPSFEGMKVEVIKSPAAVNKLDVPKTEDATTGKGFQSPFNFGKKETLEKKEPSTALVVERKNDDQEVSIPKELIIGGGGAIAVAAGVVTVSSGVLGGGDNNESVPTGQSGGSTWKPPEDVPYGLRGKQDGGAVPKGFNAPKSSTPKGAVTVQPKMGSTKAQEGAKTATPPLKGVIMKKVGDGPLPPGAKMVKKVAKLPAPKGMGGPPKGDGGMKKSPDVRGQSASNETSDGLSNTTSPKGVSVTSNGAVGMTKSSALNQQPSSGNMSGGIAKISAPQGMSGSLKEVGGMMKSLESKASFTPKGVNDGMPKMQKGVGGMMKSPEMKTMTGPKSAYSPPEEIGGMMKSPELKGTLPPKNTGQGSSGMPGQKGSAPQMGTGSMMKSPSIQSRASFGNLSGGMSKTPSQPDMKFPKASSSMSSGSMTQTPISKSSPSQKGSTLGMSGIPMKGAGPTTNAAPKWKTSPSLSSGGPGIGVNGNPLNYSTSPSLKSLSLDTTGSFKSGLKGDQGMSAIQSKAPKLKSEDGTGPSLGQPGFASFGGPPTGKSSKEETKSPPMKSLDISPKDASSGPGFVMGCGLKGAAASPKGMEKKEIQSMPGMPTKEAGLVTKAAPKWKSSTSASSTGGGLGSGVPGSFISSLSSQKETPTSSSSQSFGSSLKGSSSSGPGFVTGSGVTGAAAAPNGEEIREISGMPSIPTKGAGPVAKTSPKWKSSTSPSSTGGGLGSGATGDFAAGLYSKKVKTSSSTLPFGFSPKGSSSSGPGFVMGSGLKDAAAAPKGVEKSEIPVMPGMPTKGPGPVAKAAPKWKSSVLPSGAGGGLEYGAPGDFSASLPSQKESSTSSSTQSFGSSPNSSSSSGPGFVSGSSPKSVAAAPKSMEKAGMPVMPGMPTKGPGPAAKAAPKWKSSTSPSSTGVGLGSGSPGGLSSQKATSTSSSSPSLGSSPKGFGIGSSMKGTVSVAAQKGTEKGGLPLMPGMPIKGAGPVAKAVPKWKSSPSSTSSFSSSPKGAIDTRGSVGNGSTLKNSVAFTSPKGMEKGGLPVMSGIPTKGSGPMAKVAPKWKSSTSPFSAGGGLESGVPGGFSARLTSQKEKSSENTPSLNSPSKGESSYEENYGVGNSMKSADAFAAQKGASKAEIFGMSGMPTKLSGQVATAAPKWKSSPSKGSSIFNGSNIMSTDPSFQSAKGVVPPNDVKKGVVSGSPVGGAGRLKSSPDGPSSFSLGRSMKQQSNGSSNSSPYIPSYVDTVIKGSIGSKKAMPNVAGESLENGETNGDQYYQDSKSSVPLQDIPPTDDIESPDAYLNQIQSMNPSQHDSSFSRPNQFGGEEDFLSRRSARHPAQPPQYETGQTIGFGTTSSFSRKSGATQIPPTSRRVGEIQSMPNRLKSTWAADTQGIDLSVGPPQRKSTAIPNHSFNQPDTKSARDVPTNPNSFLGSLASRTQGSPPARDISQFDQRSRLDRLSTGVNDPSDRRNRVSLNQPKPSIRGNRGRSPSYTGGPGGSMPDDNEPLTVTITDPRTGEKRKISVTPRNTGTGAQ